MPAPTSFPPLYSVGSAGTIDIMNPSLEYDGDPRGIAWLYEPPNRQYTYVMGIDPTQGRTGWNRFSRVKSDKRVNNGSIEIVRMGRQYFDPAGKPQHTRDIQVCEFAAPIDPIELGYVANLLGRLYAGKEEDQCMCIVESHPGPGVMTMRQLVDMGYTNLWRWQYYGDLVPESSKSVGWTATERSVRDLWIKSLRHLTLQRVLIRSPFLVEEYADARMNDVKGYAESPNNAKGHGDRMRAFNLALWAGNKWDMEIERTNETVSTQPQVTNFAASDMSLEQIQAAYEDMMDRMLAD